MLELTAGIDSQLMTVIVLPLAVLVKNTGAVGKLITIEKSGWPDKKKEAGL
jgi:hypothetical protein